MKRSWILIAVVCVLLCLIVPFSSKAPDAVQHSLGLSGGTETAGKAIVGVAVTAVVMIGLASILGKKK